MSDPFNIDKQRALIDAHKANLRSNPYKTHAYFALSQHTCVKYWIEQIADAEMYEQRWHELEAEKGRVEDQ